MPWATGITDWPTANDSSYGSGVARSDGIDVVWAKDVNFLYTQTEELQKFAGNNGDLIGENQAATEGPGGIYSPRDPAASVGIELATKDEYIGAAGFDLLQVIDDRGGTGAGPTIVVAVDSDGIMSVSGGIDLGSAVYFEVPHDVALPGTFQAGRLFRNDTDGLLYMADGATWNPVFELPGEIYSLEVGQYSYNQLAVPVEDVIGQFTFDGSTVLSGKSAYLRCMMTPTFTVAGSAYVRIYDVGPAAGPPTAPVEITQNAGAYALVQTVAGAGGTLTFLETSALTIGGGGPAVGVISNTNRMYEVSVYQSSAAGDTVHVGSAGLVLR